MNPQILVQPYYFCLSLGFPFGFISISWNKLLHFIIRFLMGFQHSHYFISDFFKSFGFSLAFIYVLVIFPYIMYLNFQGLPIDIKVYFKIKSIYLLKRALFHKKRRLTAFFSSQSKISISAKTISITFSRISPGTISIK